MSNTTHIIPGIFRRSTTRNVDCSTIYLFAVVVLVVVVIIAELRSFLTIVVVDVVVCESDDDVFLSLSLS